MYKRLSLRSTMSSQHQIFTDYVFQQLALQQSYQDRQATAWHQSNALLNDQTPKANDLVTSFKALSVPGLFSQDPQIMRELELARHREFQMRRDSARGSLQKARADWVQQEREKARVIKTIREIEKLKPAYESRI